MAKLLDFIEQHKYGIFITIVVHIAIFVYFQIATYKEYVTYEAWDFITADSEAPDDIVINPDEIEFIDPEFFAQQEEVRSSVRDENDSREQSMDRNEIFTSYSRSGNAENIEREYEQQLKDEIQRSREESDQGKENSSTSTDIEKDPIRNPENVKKGGPASEKAVGGATMVSFSLANRHPLNHNDWYIRNPGYTCGNVNGVVKVAISVDEGGRVVVATIVENESVSATSCMKQKAREYALMSRFNYSSSAPKKQDGVITYRFVYRE